MKSVLSLTLIAWLMTAVVPRTADAQTQATPLVEGSVVLEPDAWPHGTSTVTSGGGGEVGILLGTRHSIRLGAERLRDGTGTRILQALGISGVTRIRF
jgi:hypothetical protein